VPFSPAPCLPPNRCRMLTTMVYYTGLRLSAGRLNQLRLDVYWASLAASSNDSLPCWLLRRYTAAVTMTISKKGDYRVPVRAAFLAQELLASDGFFFHTALNCACISSVFLTALSTEENNCLNCIWRAGFSSFGLAYSALPATRTGHAKCPADQLHLRVWQLPF